MYLLAQNFYSRPDTKGASDRGCCPAKDV